MTSTRIICAAAITLACVVVSAPAIARQVGSLQVSGQDVHGFTQAGQNIATDHARGSTRLTRVVGNARHIRAGGRRHGAAQVLGDPRPRAWCGWQMRQWMHVADRKFNLARNWVHYGTPATGPAPGVIAIFARKGGGHVGIVTAVPRPGVIVLKSGNDGHAVRERERSTRGIIAYRWPPGFRYAGI